MRNICILISVELSSRTNLRELRKSEISPFGRNDIISKRIKKLQFSLSFTHYAWKCAEFLRDEGFNVVLHCGGGSFKTQMRKADASGASYAVIIGDEELKTQEVTLKPLREAIAQARIKLAIVGEIIRKEHSNLTT